MAEAYVDSSTVIRQKIYWAGAPVDTDSAPVVKIYDVTEDPAIVPAINPETILLSITATNLDTDNGNYQIVLPFSLTSRNRKLKLVWEYTVSSTAGRVTSYVNVVTPYVDISEAIDSLGIGVDPSDSNYKSYEEICKAEKYARKVIEHHTGQSFYLYDDVVVAYGSDSDTLPLPAKINELHELYGNEILLLDNINSVDNIGYDIVVSETGYGLKIDRNAAYDNTVYLANGMVSPTIYDQGPNGFFRDRIKYQVQGRFGWDTVPEEVNLAAIELMKDYFNKDNSWKHRYTKRIQTFDWSFEFNDDVYSGTGNFYVDQLLADYVLTQMVVI